MKYNRNMITYLLKNKKNKEPVMVQDVLVLLKLLLYHFMKLTIPAMEMIQREEKDKQVSLNTILRVGASFSQKKELGKGIELLAHYFVSEEDFCFWEKTIKNSGLNTEEIKQYVEELVGQYFVEKFYPEKKTPGWLKELAVGLLHFEGGTFYDGWSGVGDTAVEVWRCAKKKAVQVSITTQERAALFFGISVIRSFILEIESCRQVQGDSILEPLLAKNGQMEKFDYSLMFPPLGGGLQYNRHQYKKSSHKEFDFLDIPMVTGEWLLALHQIESLRKGGRGVCCLFNGALFNQQYKQIREYLIKNRLIEGIISFPANVLPFTAVQVSLIIFAVGVQNKKIYMLDADEILKSKRNFYYGEKKDMPEEIGRELFQIYEEKKEIENISNLISYEDIDSEDLLPSDYLKKSMLLKGKYGDFVVYNPEPSEREHWIALEEIGEFYRGVNITNAVEKDENGDIKIIKLADVQDGKLCFDQIQRYRLKSNAKVHKYQVRKGDLLISCKGASIKICIVPEEEEKLLLSQHFIGIHVDQQRYSSAYLKEYLESPVGQYSLYKIQKGSSIVMINAQDLARVLVPGCSVHKQENLVAELSRAEDMIEAQRKRLLAWERLLKNDFYEKIGILSYMKSTEEEECEYGEDKSICDLCMGKREDN